MTTTIERHFEFRQTRAAADARCAELNTGKYPPMFIVIDGPSDRDRFAICLRSEEIAMLNDEARIRHGANSRIVQTNGIMMFSLEDQARIREMVEEFDSFHIGNNPHQERDFGAFDFKDECVFWKIDYFDMALEHGSEDPSDPCNTIRVLTIMLAREYRREPNH